MQKQSSRNLVISPNTQAAYGGILADGNLTVRQRFNPSTVFSKEPSFRSDQMSSGKGTEWATNSQITAWGYQGDSPGRGGRLPARLDVLRSPFGQEVVIGRGSVHPHLRGSVDHGDDAPAPTLYVEERRRT